MTLTASDRLLEDIYDLIDKQDGEQRRTEVARIALLAAEYRANQLRLARMAKARAARHIQRPDGGPRLSPGGRPAGEGELQ